MTILNNQALASLLGAQFGGDGRTTFNLPDLRGRVALSQGVNQQATPPVAYAVGNSGGKETVALTAAQMPQHTHQMSASTLPGTLGVAANNLLAATPASHNLYAPPPSTSPALTSLTGDTVGVTGGGGAHNNMQPSLVLNFCICTLGVYPQRP